MREYLKLLRKQNNLTQEQVAIKMSVKRQYYNLIENGNRQKRMDIQIANQLAKVFSVPLDYILIEESKLHSNAS